MDWVLVGLGNPGPEYALNRHNVGFMCVDVIASSYTAGPFKIKNSMALSMFHVEEHRIFLCKPHTYMNLSARAVAPLLSFYNVPLDRLVVFNDDLDLEPGRIKIKKGGGNGGHNGLKSLDQTVGKEYWRVRIGIGHPGHKDDVSPYVLGNFSRYDLNGWVPDILARLSDGVSSFIETSDATGWMNGM
jgi:PTH1 family peptidyl-tRNA hydrolase